MEVISDELLDKLINDALKNIDKIKLDDEEIEDVEKLLDNEGEVKKEHKKEEEHKREHKKEEKKEHKKEEEHKREHKKEHKKEEKKTSKKRKKKKHHVVSNPDSYLSKLTSTNSPISRKLRKTIRNLKLSHDFEIVVDNDEFNPILKKRELPLHIAEEVLENLDNGDYKIPDKIIKALNIDEEDLKEAISKLAEYIEPDELKHLIKIKGKKEYVCSAEVVSALEKIFTELIATMIILTGAYKIVDYLDEDEEIPDKVLERILENFYKNVRTMKNDFKVVIKDKEGDEIYRFSIKLGDWTVVSEPERAIKSDIARTKKNKKSKKSIKSVIAWILNPYRYDLVGIDTKKH